MLAAMTLDQLKTFLWVARLGGLRRAAEQMNISQPAISARLAALEDRLKTPLFERTARGVSLTNKGALLLRFAEQIVFVEEEIVSRIANEAEVDGLMRIGAAETIAQSWLPDFLQVLAQEFPRLILDLTVDISVNLREALLTRQLDLAFLMGPVSDYRITNVPLPAFELAWLRRSGSDGAPDTPSTPVLSYSRNTRPYRELVDELARRYGPGARVYASASLSASIRMIAAGIGVGPFPLTLATEAIAAGTIERFDPGWCPSPLVFTASFSAEPRNAIAERCAHIARTTANAWHEPTPSDQQT
ncbi:MAG: LysR family transcriptional regulator [Devosia sp.]